jgi:general secretion pathway protein C
VDEKGLNHNRPMVARLSAFVVWAVFAASAVFWGLRLAGSSPVAPAHTVPVGGGDVPHAGLSRLFGVPVQPVAEAAPPPEQGRFKLIGLAAPKEVGGPGVAVIAIDGKPPRAYHIGSVVDGDVVLQAIERRAVALGPQGGSAALRLELPALPAAATGSLAPPSFGNAAVPPQPAPTGMPPQQNGGPAVSPGLRPSIPAGQPTGQAIQ